jgi:hypothetical protein
MNRTLLSNILAGSILALGASVASAHGSFPFEDAYWKAPLERTSMQQAAPIEKSRYDLVDNYNY